MRLFPILICFFITIVSAFAAPPQLPSPDFGFNCGSTLCYAGSPTSAVGIDAGGTNSDFAAGVFPLTDQRMLLVGSATTASNGTVVAFAMLRADGRRDSDFAVNGVRVSSLSIGTIEDVERDSSGRILVLFRATAPVFSAFLYIARFSPDGTVDGQFGFGGIASIGFPGGGRTESNRLAVMSDNRPLVISTLRLSGTPNRVFAARFTAQGFLDSSFFMNGLLRLDGLLAGVVDATLFSEVLIAARGFSAVSVEATTDTSVRTFLVRFGDDGSTVDSRELDVASCGQSGGGRVFIRSGITDDERGGLFVGDYTTFNPTVVHPLFVRVENQGLPLAQCAGAPLAPGEVPIGVARYHPRVLVVGYADVFTARFRLRSFRLDENDAFVAASPDPTDFELRWPNSAGLPATDFFGTAHLQFGGGALAFATTRRWIGTDLDFAAARFTGEVIFFDGF